MSQVIQENDKTDSYYENDEFESVSVSKSVGIGILQQSSSAINQKKANLQKRASQISHKSKSSAGVADDYENDEFDSVSMSKSISTSVPLQAGKKSEIVQCPKCLQFFPKAVSKNHINQCKSANEKSKFTNYSPIKEEK